MKKLKITTSGYKSKRGGNVFWGVVFIAAAVLIIIDAVGICPDLPFIKIVLGVLCAAWFAKEVIKMHLTGIFFPLAFMFMIFEKEIAAYAGVSENILSNWLVLLTAFLLTIGTNLIFGNMKFSYSASGHIVSSSASKNQFGEGVKYIDSSNFQYEYVKNSFGEYHIYFQNTDLYEGGATLEVSNSFGEIDIHVPADWNVQFEVKNYLGEAALRGKVDPDGKVLKIIGSNKFGETNACVE